MADLVLNALRRNLAMAERSGDKARARRLQTMIDAREVVEEPKAEAKPRRRATSEAKEDAAEPVTFTPSAVLDEAVDKPAPRPRGRRPKAEVPEPEPKPAAVEAAEPEAVEATQDDTEQEVKE